MAQHNRVEWTGNIQVVHETHEEWLDRELEEAFAKL
jgi:hypothetical protein